MFRRKGPSDVEIARENEIKIGITQELSKALKNVQKENVDSQEQRVYSCYLTLKLHVIETSDFIFDILVKNNNRKCIILYITLTETANSVCHCLEAVFLHGLKSSSVKKIANIVGLAQEKISQPGLNFWNLAAKFTHSEVVSQLKHLGQITSEIGLCRSWIRVALNDCLIESYVDAMVADKKTLEYFYHRTSYLRDSEQPEIMKSLIHGLMTFEFKLSYNSSVLNEWSYAPLRLSGIINVNDAPLPVIKPAASKLPKPKSSNLSDSEVQPVKPGSRGNAADGSRKSRRKDNPMEQPMFGAPPDSSYYVSSSEFTSKDVEDFKKLASLSSPVAPSECSTSSHVSCPDPPHLNLSPAAYVQNKYSDYSGSPKSSKTGASDGSFDESGNVRDRLKHSDVVDSQDLVSEESVNYTETEIGKMKPQLDINFPEVSQPSQELLDEIYSEMKQTDDLLDGPVNEDSGTKNELEESWEEFYKSPVRKVANDKPFQRLESFQQEIKEKQILESFVHSDDDGEKESTRNVYDDVQTLPLTDSNEIDKILAERCRGEKESLKKADIFTDDEFNAVLNKIQQEVQENIQRKLDTSGNTSVDCDMSANSSNEEISRGSNNSTNVTDKAIKGLEDDKIASSENKPQVYIEEKVPVHDADDDEQIEHRTSSPSKKKKGRGKTLASKLKPNVNLSPSDMEPLEPELSDAVADRVDRMQTLENPDYLRKHRMSLPVASKGPGALKKDQRKSLPYVLENKTVATAETLTGIQEHLLEIYDGKPIDEDDKDQITEEEEEVLREKMVSMDHRQSVGNNLMLTGRGWSSSFDSELDDPVDAFSPPRSQGTFPVMARPKAESFGTLLQNYTPASSASAPSIDGILQHFPRKDTVLSPSKSGPSSPPEDFDYIDDFEVVTHSDHPDPTSLEKLTQVVEIANEMGLDAQNFQCKGCSRALGLIFGKPRVCKYDGGYYCYECHENDEYYIPAVILHNWDFRKHKVCKKNLAFLQEIEEQPCINVEEANPRLYDHVPEMRETKALRNQLMYLKTYLFTCKQSTAEDLRRLVWPRDYLCENMELYSLADLLQVPTGVLASSIRKVIKFATKHVYSCPLCNQKGFICELCNNPKVIYPFEMDSTYRCPTCKSVFHKDCKTDNRPCPKCQRRLLRESTHGISESETTLLYDYVMP